MPLINQIRHFKHTYNSYNGSCTDPICKYVHVEYKTLTKVVSVTFNFLIAIIKVRMTFDFLYPDTLGFFRYFSFLELLVRNATHLLPPEVRHVNGLVSTM